MKESQLKSLFKKNAQNFTAPEEEWTQLKEKTRLVPLPQRLTLRLGVAFALVILFSYTMTPYFHREKTHTNEAELLKYMFENSVPYPYEEDATFFIEEI